MTLRRARRFRAVGIVVAAGLMAGGPARLSGAESRPTALQTLRAPELGQPDGKKSAEATVPQRYEFVSPHMGTLWKLVFHEADPERAQRIRTAVRERLQEIDSRLSDYQPQSELNRFCNAGVADSPSADLYAVTVDSIEVARATAGAFDPTVSPLTRLWRASRKARRLPDPAAVAEARRATGFDAVEVEKGRLRLKKPGVTLDFGGIAKGYAQDEIARLLEEKFSLKAFLLDAGGGVLAGGPPPGRDAWAMTIDAVPGEVSPTAIFLRKGALATSGDAHQALEIEGIRYSHIVDPATGMGLTNGLQVSVISSSGAVSDALATAFCVMGLEKTKAFVAERREVLVRAAVVQPGKEPAVWTSAGWPVR